MSSHLLPGAILAAGQSLRMGRSKALLPAGPGAHVTFVEQIAGAMRAAGIADVLVVGRPDDAELMDVVVRLTGPVRLVGNPDHRLGQLSSVVAAVNAVDRPGVGGLLVIPVDMPLVRRETFAAAVQAAASHPRSIVRAACRGRHGHPVVFDRGSFDALRRADPSVGAKAVLRASADRVFDLDVQDEGVLQDVDSLQDYVAVFGGPPDAPGSAVP